MKALVIGGAGFIGCHLADHHLRQGDEVIILDDLSRLGTDLNLAWLRERGKHRVTFVKGDIVGDRPLLRGVVEAADRVYHLAAQVAVTTSVTDPRRDFEINALGTFNVLEAVRVSPNRPPLFFASTNKVYGGMEDVAVELQNDRWAYRDLPGGAPETQPLDFHSPYGCSKGAADQYVRDYARIYGLRTVVFRQSCIYGTRQFGVEDQGWVAHFIIATSLGRPLTIYGDGKQVRDLLWIDDLIAAYAAAGDRLDDVSGKIFNLGGGPENVLSLRELVVYLEELFAKKIPLTYAGTRPGDQPVFVADIGKAGRELGWRPQVGARAGVQRLVAWVRENPALFAGLFKHR